MCRLPYNHGGEQLSSEPRATAWAHGLLDDGHLNVGVFAELVGAREAGGASTDDDDVGIGVGDHVGHVPSGHFTGDDGFFDGLEGEGAEVVRGCGHGDGGGLVLV